MSNILTAIAVMLGATIGQHLGLTEAIAKVLCKIAGCNMCCSFWASAFTLVYFRGVPLDEAALLSVFVAYLSNWFVFVMVRLQDKYNDIWQRMQRK